MEILARTVDEFYKENADGWDGKSNLLNLLNNLCLAQELLIDEASEGDVIGGETIMSERTSILISGRGIGLSRDDGHRRGGHPSVISGPIRTIPWTCGTFGPSAAFRVGNANIGAIAWYSTFSRLTSREDDHVSSQACTPATPIVLLRRHSLMALLAVTSLQNYLVAEAGGSCHDHVR